MRNQVLSIALETACEPWPIEPPNPLVHGSLRILADPMGAIQLAEMERGLTEEQAAYDRTLGAVRHARALTQERLGRAHAEPGHSRHAPAIRPQPEALAVPGLHDPLLPQGHHTHVQQVTEEDGLRWIVPGDPFADRQRETNVVPAFPTDPVLQVADAQVEIARLDHRFGAHQALDRELADHWSENMLPPILRCLSERDPLPTLV